MRFSVFSTIRNYWYDVYLRFKSVWGSFMTAAPYLWSMGDLRKEVTEQYPDPISSRTSDDLPARSRGLLYNDINRCTGCRECEKICPVQCIRIETEAGPDASKLWVSTFDIDFAKCVFCGYCVETCHPQSLVHSKQYEGAVYDLKDLVASFGSGFLTNEQRAKWAAMRRQAESDEVFL